MHREKPTIAFFRENSIADVWCRAVAEYGISSKYNMIFLTGLLIFGNLSSLVSAEKSMEAGLSVPKGRSTKNSTYNISVSIACRNIYHLFGIVEFPSTGNLPHPVEAYSLLCESTFTNLFCLVTNNSDWQKGLCNISHRIIECPLHGQYGSYSQFFTWKISSYVVRFVYELGGKQHITGDKVFTPYLQCPDISTIGQHDKMFRLQDHIHQD